MTPDELQRRVRIRYPGALVRPRESLAAVGHTPETVAALGLKAAENALVLKYCYHRPMFDGDIELQREWHLFALFAVKHLGIATWGVVDHIDGHRTVGLVISPFVKRNRVDSIYYNQTSMIRTIEELLGMPPMNKLFFQLG